ncbi:MAG: SGNH/GDSL hydrolase family protein [Planctomycetes bacterium]|nr:SGNH/GDSL hydrolase family protein [Planctomycetota bacterium]
MARRKKPIVLLALVAGAIAFALALAEIALRQLPAKKPSPPLGALSYETIDGEPVANLQEGVAKGFIVMLPPKLTPRPRGMFAPGHSFYLRYADQDRLHCDWLDEQGRVLVRINDQGLRERPEITPDKPAGQRRIVCLGDSFTFGWGVPEELGWVRLLEQALRRSDDRIRTVNCGAAGTICVDEYWYGLKNRFHVFQPDAVLVTICLNDLVPSNGLYIENGEPPPDTGSRVLDLLLGAFRRGPLDLDPAVDWVQVLLDLPADSTFYAPDKPFDSMWSQGAPQRALAAMKSWCDERNIKLMVSLWPFLQGLGDGQFYPFEKLHRLVADECGRLGIPFHDVLPALRGHRPEELWVTPADMHANPTAQALALPGIEAFVREQSGLF